MTKMSFYSEADRLAAEIYKKFLLNDDTWMVDARNLPKDNVAWLKLAELLHITTKEERGERKEEELDLMVSLMHDLAEDSLRKG